MQTKWQYGRTLTPYAQSWFQLSTVLRPSPISLSLWTTWLLRCMLSLDRSWQLARRERGSLACWFFLRCRKIYRYSEWRTIRQVTQASPSPSCWLPGSIVSIVHCYLQFQVSVEAAGPILPIWGGCLYFSIFHHCSSRAIEDSYWCLLIWYLRFQFSWDTC